MSHLLVALLTVPALAGTAQVEITSSREGLTVTQGLEGAPLCEAPCTVDLDVKTEYLGFSGAKYTPLLHRVTLSEGERLHLDVRPGNRGASTAGGIFGIGAVGLLVASTVSFAVADDKTAAGVMIGGSLLSGLVALPLTSAGKTKVRTRR